MNLGYRLRQLRKQEKLTMEELADELNKMFPNEDYSKSFGKGTISKWENNRVDPAVSSIAKVAKFFNVTLDYLLGLEDENTKQSVIEVPVVNNFNNVLDSKNIISYYYVPRTRDTIDKNLIYLPVEKLNKNKNMENQELALIDLDSTIENEQTGVFILKDGEYPVIRKMKTADDYIILIEHTEDGESPTLYKSKDVKRIGKVLSYIRYIPNDEIKSV